MDAFSIFANRYCLNVTFITLSVTQSVVVSKKNMWPNFHFTPKRFDNDRPPSPPKKLRLEKVVNFPKSEFTSSTKHSNF